MCQEESARTQIEVLPVLQEPSAGCGLRREEADGAVRGRRCQECRVWATLLPAEVALVRALVAPVGPSVWCLDQGGCVLQCPPASVRAWPLLGNLAASSLLACM